MSLNLGASTSWNSQGLSRPAMRLLLLFSVVKIHGCCVCGVAPGDYSIGHQGIKIGIIYY
jgi:hypothetical protein